MKPTGAGKGGSGPLESRDPIGNVAVKPFGKYFLVRKLAEGGMAEIFLAKQVGVEGFEKNVVIKRMLQHLSSVPDFVSMFLDEARLASRLAHPNIVTITDLGHADGCYYISMEYLAGEDFSTMLRTAARRREYVPLHISVRVLSDAARGLDFAHNFTDSQGKPLNVVHRDISPSNIFVTYTGQVKVLDFGIAKAESRVTNTTAGVVKGKYMYMAPEQARSGQVDRRADVFSLGVSLYESLTNVRPFARDNDLAILNAVLQGDYRPPRTLRPDLSPELEAVVSKALALKPEDRYQSAAEFATDLDRFLAAYTSGSGGTAVSAFMHSFFGPDRVANKTRIDSLEEMAKKGFDVPGLPNPMSPKTDPDHTPARLGASSGEAATRAGVSPSSVIVDRRKRVGAVVIGTVVGLAVLAMGTLGVYLGVVRPRQGEGAAGGGEPPVLVDAGQAPPEPVVDAGPVAAPAATPDAGPPEPAALKPDAGAPGKPPSGPLPQLTVGTIVKLIGQHKSELSACFTKNSGDLPAAKGQFVVDFTIAGSGKVTRVASEAADKGVGRCVENEVRAIRFPAHRDKEIGLKLPLSYDLGGPKPPK